MMIRLRHDDVYTDGERDVSGEDWVWGVGKEGEVGGSELALLMIGFRNKKRKIC